MNTPPWLQPLANRVLGTEPHRRRHVLMVLLTLQPYLVCVGVILHSHHLGLLDGPMAKGLAIVSVLCFTSFFAMVRSGWSQRFADPVLAFPHAFVSIGLCLIAYAGLGLHRGDVMILIAQTIVMSMFRLKPMQVLLLGIFTVTGLAIAVLGLTLWDPSRFAPAVGWTHFVVGGSTLLMLSLIGKWVSDIRVRIGRQARELQEAVDTVKQMATTDMLTGALNRRMMTELAEAELKLTVRTGAPLCVALIDIDFFKRVNDELGHHAGDAVLRGLAQHAVSQIRQVDKFGRWGGEEFLIMLPSIALPEAMTALERLRQSMAELGYPGYHGLRVSFSAGLAQAQPGETLEHLVERADDALYEAKRLGRNRTQTAATDVRTASTPSTEALP